MIGRNEQLVEIGRQAVQVQRLYDECRSRSIWRRWPIYKYYLAAKRQLSKTIDFFICEEW